MTAAPRSEHRVLELRMRGRWRILVALAVVAFGLLASVGVTAVLSGGPTGIGDILLAAFIVATLGGLIVIPGVAMLARTARGIPGVRIDDAGVVWGRDRSRDLAIDWADVDCVIFRTVRSQGFTSRAFVITGAPDAIGTPARTLYGRVVAATNRASYGSPWAISTRTVDRTSDEIRTAIAAHIGSRLTVEP